MSHRESRLAIPLLRAVATVRQWVSLTLVGRLALWAAAFVTAFEGQVLLDERHLGRAVVYMAVATVLIAAATWRQRLNEDVQFHEGAGPDNLRQPLRSAAVPIALLLVALGLGVAFRVYRLPTDPFGIWFDEAQNGIIADRMINDSDYRPVFITGYTGTNRPALPVYVFAVGVKLMGRDILALRSVSAIAGAFTLVPLFFLARELFGLRIAALATFFLAVMRWHLNFSRVAMEPIWAPFFAVSAVFFLVRGVRRGRWYDFAASGLLLGLGLHFYWAFLLVPLLYALFAAHSFLVRQSVRLVSLAVGALLVAVVGFAAYSPVAVYGVQHPDQYKARANTVSITKGKDLEETIRAVQRTTRLHVLMFNSAGDRNGRHNLPGAPMLDTFTGIFFVLGLGMSLSRFWQPRYLLVLAWVVALLQPAIWSVEFEAPQALRAILVTPAVALLAALPLGALWEMVVRQRKASPEVAAAGDAGQVWRRWLSRLRGEPLRYLAAGAVGVTLLFFLAQTAYRNFDTFFNVQLNDPRVWMEFNAPSTVVAEEMKRLGEDHRFLVSSLVGGHPAVEFVYPKVKELDRIQLNVASDLPLGESRPTAIFLDITKAPYARWLRSLYPDAEVIEVKPPGPGQPTMVYEILVSPESIDRIRGLEATYQPQDGPPLQRREPALDLDWTSTTPVSLPFEARWSGLLKVAEYGSHRLVVEAPGRLKVRLDGELVGEGDRRVEVELMLFRGDHRLEVEASVDRLGRVSLSDQGQPVPASAYFSTPDAGRGLLATFYTNEQWSGQPALQEMNPFIGFRYHAELPFGSPFSAVWSGWLEAPTDGSYTLEVEAVDSASVAIDGREVIAISGQRAAEVNLTAGPHDLEVRFRNRGGYAQVFLYWTPPGGQREVIPTQYLSPP